jgi:hypothetical protein
LENLQQNEQFISAVIQASQIAMRTHEAEKLAALRNAIVNLAQGQSVDDTLLQILLSHIDSLTEMHIRLLKVFQEPKVPSQWIEDKINLYPIIELVSYNIPELKESEIAPQLLMDLNTRGLIGVDAHSSARGEDLMRPRLNPLGQRLIQLIVAQPQ